MNTIPHANRLSSLTCQSIMTSIMQNKPNFRKAKMNVNIYYTKAYNNETASGSRKNKPNSKPISSKAKMNLKSLAKKSGHTLIEPCSLFLLYFIVLMYTLNFPGFISQQRKSQ